MSQFTPVSAVIGGGLIGIATVLLLWFNGRVGGISGIVGRALGGPDRTWRVLFLLGLVLGGAVYRFAGGTVPELRGGVPVRLLAVAGLLVGYGATLGSGCTSGHGVSGVARLSLRSWVATLTFLGFAIVSTWGVRHGLGMAT